MRPRWVSLALVAAMLLPSAYLIPRFWDRIETFRQFEPARRSELLKEPGFRGRLSENLVAVRMFGDHPIVGSGIGNYRPLYQQYARPLGIDPRTIPRRAHNMYLETAAETGLVGAVLLLLFLILLLSALRNAYRKMKPDETPVVFACGLAIVAYLLSSLFLSRILATSLPFWALAGIALALPGVTDRQLRNDASSF
jgi:O-antigen ligase